MTEAVEVMMLIFLGFSSFTVFVMGIAICLIIRNEL